MTKKKPVIVFTGGGSAGHVSLNLALIPWFHEQDWEIHYMGSYEGIEREMTGKYPYLTYHPISTGKLRRYFDLKNATDALRVLRGTSQAILLLRRLKPSVVFSKGGFVSLPVVIGARCNQIPVVSHESDITPGLANRLALPFTQVILTTFKETQGFLPASKVFHAGPLIRQTLHQGEAARGYVLTGFDKSRPILLVMGGSLGAKAINEAVRKDLKELTKFFQVIHICGKGNVKKELDSSFYRQFEFVDEDLPDLLAIADVAMSRAGANAIFEFLELSIPMLLVPLPRGASRGDQILNAQSFEDKNFAQVLTEDRLLTESLSNVLQALYVRRKDMIVSMQASGKLNPFETITQAIFKAAHL